MMQILLFLSILLALYTFSIVDCVNDDLIESLKHIKPQASEEDQSYAVVLLIKRLVPNHSSQFVVTVNKNNFFLKDGMDAFRLSTLPDGRIQINGTTGVAAASGLYYYLKYSCGCSISWSGNQLNLPDVLPQLDTVVQKEFHERFRYYQNVCTVSYSMAFWNWTRWEREIDWMALNGINLPLAFNGQETIWQMVYKKLGLTQEELDTHFAGPAFQAWGRMGNIDQWGGPLPASWFEQQLSLQHQILKRMRSLGMIPVLPGFAGHIPKPLVTRLYPNVTYYKLQGWNGFVGKYGTYLLDVHEPLFQQIGNMFIDAQQTIYNGTDHIYDADVYNEMQPPTLTTEFMKLTSQKVYQGMAVKDPQAVWLMQAWLFRADYWTDPLKKAWISANPYGRFIVLDLGSEWAQVYKQTKGYYGYPFIWTMIQNFGGTTRLFGQLDLYSKDVQSARVSYSSNMIGIGATPEGIEQNDIDFELMYEIGWRDEIINVTEWGKQYASRRYGGTNSNIEDAWDFLAGTLYNLEDLSINGIDANTRPAVMLPLVTKKIGSKIWYDPRDLRHAWEKMFYAAPYFEKSSTFRYDIVHLGAQALEDLSLLIYQHMMNAYFNNSLDSFIVHSQYFIDLLTDMETILATEPHSLLGTWTESAKRLGRNDEEMKLLDYNARMQITIWGTNSSLDYAAKQWSGLMKDYYQPRWRMFNDVIIDCMQTKKVFNSTIFNEAVRQNSLTWTSSRNVYPEQPVGDWYSEIFRLLKKYINFEEDHGIDGDMFWSGVLNEAKINRNINFEVV